MKLKFGFGILISLIFLYLIFHQVDFYKIGQDLKSANYLYLLPFIVVIIFALLIRAYRWGYLIEPIKKVTFVSLLSATSIGFMANFILPARMGEFVRAYVIGNKENLSKSASFATIVVERLFDVFTILIFLMLILTFITIPSGMEAVGYKLKIGGFLTFIVCLLATAFLVFLKYSPKKFFQFVQFILSPFPKSISKKIINLLNFFVLGLDVLQKERHLVMVTLFSILLWVIAAAGNYFMFLSFGLDLPLYASFFLLVAQVLALTVPSSPGFVGTYHAACVYGLSFFGVGREKALSFAVVAHATNFVVYVSLGLMFLWIEKLSIKEIQHSQETQT